MAWRASSLSLWEFEILIFLIGCGFGAMPPLASTALQNSVSIHTFGSAVATMQFSRNLYATMIVAVFGALVLVGVAGGPAAASEPTGGCPATRNSVSRVRLHSAHDHRRCPDAG